MHWSYMFNIFKSIILRTSWFFRPQLASDKLSRIWMRVFTVKTMGNSDDKSFFLQSFPFKVLRRTAALVSMCSRKMQKSAIFRDIYEFSYSKKSGKLWANFKASVNFINLNLLSSYNHSLFHCTIFPFIEYYGLSQGCAKIGDSWWTLEAPKHWTSLLVCIIASKFLVNFFFVNFFFFCISNSSNCYSWMS